MTNPDALTLGIALSQALGADPATFSKHFDAASTAVGEWQADEKLRAEFGYDFSKFLAFKKADQRGAAKIYSRPTVDVTDQAKTK